MWLKLKFVHNVEWGQTVLPDRYLPKMMTRSSTVVMIATAKNILKRSAPICWIFSSSWLVTTVEGMTKPNATPSCQNRFWMHYFLIFLTLHTYCLKITQKCLIFQISTIFFVQLKSDLSNNTAKMDQASKMDLNRKMDLNKKWSLKKTTLIQKGT